MITVGILTDKIIGNNDLNYKRTNAEMTGQERGGKKTEQNRMEVKASR